MKTTILLSAFSLLTALGAGAQAKKANSFASHISLGPVVSLGHSWVSDMSNDAKFKFAPAAGIGLVYSRNEHLGFGAQLLVSHEGFKQEAPTGTGSTYTVAVNPVYLRAPLHLIYFFNDYGDRVRPKVYIGPSLAVKIDERRFYSDDRMEPAEGTPAAADVFKSFDAGLAAGAGVNIRINRLTWLNLDLGYYHGLANVIEGADNSNRNLRLNAGLMWGL